jgi:Flp pilus assembly protein TadD
MSESTSSITRLSELIALHGVYALTAIFIFYQQSRATKELDKAKPDNRQYYKKVHASVVSLTYVLVIASSVIWFYATFIWVPRLCLRGSVSGLTDQIASPQKEGDPPRISETIAPESLDNDLYQSKRNKDNNSPAGKYDLGWVLLPRDNVHTLVFRFQHGYEKIKPTGKMLFDHLGSVGNVERNITEKRFSVDLRKIHYSPGGLIELLYQPNPDNQVEEIGKIYLREPDSSNLSEIPWEEITPLKATIDGQSLFTVYAAFVDTAFRENGDYDPQFGRVLQQRLADPDLRTQLAARRVLSENGKRSFKFILATLKDHPEQKENGNLIVSNIASAVLEIESAKTPVPRDVYLNLAEAFRQSGDAKSSAQFFDKAGEKQDDLATVKFQRGIVYFFNENYPAAIRNLNGVVNQMSNSQLQASVHNVLGMSYEKLNQNSVAVSHYKQAIYIAPQQPAAYNNLAYLFAEKGDNLQEALRLANQALALEKDPDALASYKDTKAWVLYKMGRQQEALPLLREAAARIPDSPEVRDHLKAVQDSIHARPQ